MTDVRILAVEDSPTQAEALRQVLEGAGYQVVLRGDGAAGLAALDEGGVDLVVSDVMMPGDVDGYELCRRIKMRAGDVPPVVLLTSLADPMDIIRGLECGADNFLTKPYDPAVLLDRIRGLLATRQVRARERVQLGVNILFMGQKYLITSDREQILDLLVSTFEDAVKQNRMLRQREQELTLAREQLDEYARSLEARLQNVLASIPDVLFSLSGDGRSVHYMSPASRKVFGDDPGRFTLEVWRNRLHPEDRNTAVSALMRAVETGEEQQVEYRILTPGGAYRWVSMVLVPVRNPEGAVERLDGIASDVTVRREAQDGMREANHTLEALFTASPLPIIALTPRGTVRMWNRAAEALFGWTASQVIGRFLPIVPEEERARFEGKLRAVLGGETFVGRVVRRRKRDGTLFDASISMAPTYDARGVVSGVMTVVEDISKWNELERQLRHSQKMEAVGRLAGGVAHDFNNLLTVILGEAGACLEEDGVRPEVRTGLEEIVAAAQRAAALTRQLLIFSRQQAVQPAALDLNAVVQGSASMLQRLVGESLTIRLALDASLPRVVADQGQLEQVLMNLVVNARDAMPGAGEIVVATEAAGLPGTEASGPGEECVVLRVTDTGAGMPPDVQARIFEPFFTTKEPGKGTGLGLATCYGIVKQHGGHIAVDSVPGQGTTFRVYLQRTLDTSEPASPAPATTPVPTVRVLLVEDDAEVRRVTVRMLGQLGQAVVEVDSPAAALDLLRDPAQRFDLLITDVVMPGMEGPALVEQANQLRPGLHVLFISGYSADALALRRLVSAGVPVLQKPFLRDELGRAIRDALSRSVAH